MDDPFVSFSKDEVDHFLQDGRRGRRGRRDGRAGTVPFSALECLQDGIQEVKAVA